MNEESLLPSLYKWNQANCTLPFWMALKLIFHSVFALPKPQLAFEWRLDVFTISNTRGIWTRCPSFHLLNNVTWSIDFILTLPKYVILSPQLSSKLKVVASVYLLGIDNFFIIFSCSEASNCWQSRNAFIHKETHSYSLPKQCTQMLLGCEIGINPAACSRRRRSIN